MTSVFSCWSSSTAVGKSSGLEVGGQMATKAANLLQVRNGKVTRLAIINDRERALGDLGFAPEARSSAS